MLETAPSPALLSVPDSSRQSMSQSWLPLGVFADEKGGGVHVMVP